MVAKVEFVILKQADKYIAYLPALDMSSFGDTYDEAVKMGSEVADIFFEETRKQGTTEKALLELGWTKLSPRKWEPPHLIGTATSSVNIPVPH